MILHQAKDRQVAADFFKYHYHDRGMLKWGGFYLSDHTSALQKMHAAEVPEAQLAAQPLAMISQSLFAAWQTQRPVHLQLNQLEDGERVVALTGTVVGMADNEIGIQTDQQKIVWLVLAAIKHVTLM
ncbi:hypothetical protein [Loigolactobacillus binensis]|uniref:DNA-directed RNA polymerase beta subunit n=1 Tax=Loigolactobacillus binensis TaxID=2559922 RepID=A0ABW3EBC5_9LACO|nr:hypothetical protein [Loigolactobacillus binensis]